MTAPTIQAVRVNEVKRRRICALLTASTNGCVTISHSLPVTCNATQHKNTHSKKRQKYRPQHRRQYISYDFILNISTYSKEMEIKVKYITVTKCNDKIPPCNIILIVCTKTQTVIMLHN